MALLLAAPLLSDLLWPVFLLLGWEHVRVDIGNTKFTPFDFYDFPWSHSLLMCLVWATLFALVYWAISRYWPGAVVIWIGVISHWILDWITHGRDLPLYPGSLKYGLGLWNSVWGTMLLEIAMFVAAVWLYWSVTRARDWMGRWPLIVFVALTLGFYLDIYFSSPPAKTSQLAWSGLIISAILLLWAWWFDAHRYAFEDRMFE